jgi:hypothetical protein
VIFNNNDFSCYNFLKKYIKLNLQTYFRDHFKRWINILNSWMRYITWNIKHIYTLWFTIYIFEPLDQFIWYFSLWIHINIHIYGTGTTWNWINEYSSRFYQTIAPYHLFQIVLTWLNYDIDLLGVQPKNKILVTFVSFVFLWGILRCTINLS